MANELFGTGQIQARLSDCDLRDVRVKGVQVAQRIYVAVRDQVWDTVPPALESSRYQATGNTAAFEFNSRYSDGEIAYWQKTAYSAIAIGEDETLVCRFDGVAQRDFKYDRIGICILIDQDFAGARFRALLSGETVAQGTLTRTVAPQPFIDGQLHPYLGPFDTFEVSAPSGQTVRYDFEGDVFELEDQRNWTDSSFKIYSTPLEAGWPLKAEAGQQFSQSVAISVSGASASVRATARSLHDSPTLKLGGPLGVSLPRIGVRLTTDESLIERQSELLCRTQLDHVRVDLQLGADWRTDLEKARSVHERTGVGIELGVHLDESDLGVLGALAGAAGGLPLSRLLLFRHGRPCSDGALAVEVRRRLGGAVGPVPLFAGTDMHFADINRFRPDMTGADGLVFPVIPTVHAVDDEAVLDNVRAQPAVVASSKELYGDLPVAISPITLRPLFNAWSDDSEGRSFEAPPDPRQFSLFGGAWTLGSIKRLALAGSQTVTYHESVGGSWSATEGRPGSLVEPLYQLFTWLAGWRQTGLMDCLLEAEPGVAAGGMDALALQRGNRARVILTNLGPEPTSVRIAPSTCTSVEMVDDLGLRRFEPDSVSGVTLGPYDMACLDVQPAHWTLDEVGDR